MSSTSPRAFLSESIRPARRASPPFWDLCQPQGSISPRLEVEERMVNSTSLARRGHPRAPAGGGGGGGGGAPRPSRGPRGGGGKTNPRRGPPPPLPGRDPTP